MFSSQINNRDVVLAIYQDIRTIFRLSDIAMLTGQTDFKSLSKKLNYAVRTFKLKSPRKGIYAKPVYNAEEMACTVYTPSYISLEYVLQKAGIVFQFNSVISVVSYLSRTINAGNQTMVYRKIKGEILVNTIGINRKNNQVNIATAERAFLDLLYLNTDYYFDNLSPLNKDLVYKILPIYQSKTLTERVNKLLPQ